MKGSLSFKKQLPGTEQEVLKERKEEEHVHEVPY
jgi:hypothetical protein